MDEAKKDKVIPIRLTRDMRQQHIHLFLMHKFINEDNNSELDSTPHVISHYCWIKNLSRLLFNQVTKTKRKLFFCDRCLQHFHNNNKLSDHMVDCMRQNDSAIKMPSQEDRFIRFKNYPHQLKAPFCVYADIESILAKPSENYSDFNGANTEAYQAHLPFSIGYYFKCDFDAQMSFYNAFR